MIKILQNIILKFFLLDHCKIFISCKKSFIISARLARYVQDLLGMQPRAQLNKSGLHLVDCKGTT